jgi:hypothetical protein
MKVKNLKPGQMFLRGQQLFLKLDIEDPRFRDYLTLNYEMCEPTFDISTGVFHPFFSEEEVIPVSTGIEITRMGA